MATITALALVREGRSLAQAAREAGTTPRTVVRWAGSALRKRPNGRYGARPHDSLTRVVVVPTAEGMREVTLGHSRDAGQVGQYWNAVHAYLATGDAARLRPFKDVTLVDTHGQRLTLLTDRADLDRLGSAGVLSFESLYGRKR